MRSLATLTIVLALITGIVPQFTNCEAAGRMLTLESGRQIPMKCHWSARGEVAIAVPMLATGVMMLVSRRKETRRVLSITNGILGVFAILIPTALIGVCGNPDMICHSTMRPLMILVGTLTVVIGGLGIVIASKQKETAV